MNRVQKKCLFASVALHGLLAGIIIVGPAFLPRKPRPPDLPILTVIPSKLIDEAFYGGGNPNGRLPTMQPPVQQPTPPAPAPAPPPAPKPEPEPAPPTPKAVTSPKKESAPVVEDVKPAVKEPGDKPAPSKSTIIVSTKLVRPKPGEGTSTPRSPVRVGSTTEGHGEARAASQAAAARLQSGVDRVVGRLSENLSSGTSIEPFGPGGGGEVYADWTQAVKSIYNAAWYDPTQVPDGSSSVRVRVKVARDGTVLADDIVKPSGIPALDQSVQEALDRVRAGRLPKLPESAKESERTFHINFDLDSKRKLG